MSGDDCGADEASSPGGEISAVTRAFRDSMHDWLANFAPGTVRATETVPTGESRRGHGIYFDTELELLPANPDALGLSIAGFQGTYAFTSVPDIGTIARRYGFVIPWYSSISRHLYFGGETADCLTNERMLEICRSFAAGNIDLQFGVFGNTVVSVDGVIHLPDISSLSPYARTMLEIHAPRRLRLLRRVLGVFEPIKTRRVEFAPWATMSGGS